MSNAKRYSTEVRTDDEWAVPPQTAIFTIDEETAKAIINFSQLVKDNGLHKVEKFEYLATYFNEDPEYADDKDADNEVRTDCDCLNVSSDEFWFSAYAKHTSIGYVTDHQSISELANHFGIELTVNH